MIALSDYTDLELPHPYSVINAYLRHETPRQPARPFDGHHLPISSCGPVLIVTPGDAVSDSASDTRFLDCLSEFVDQECPEYLLIDLTGCPFVTSSTLAGFVALNRQLEAIDGQLCICNASESVSDDFRVTQLNRLLDIRETRQDALSEWLSAEDEVLISA